MDKARKKLMEADWNIRGYAAKYIGWIMILGAILIALYRLIFSSANILETGALIFLGIIFATLFWLVSWVYLGDKKK
jgi:hypothetical protein